MSRVIVIPAQERKGQPTTENLNQSRAGTLSASLIRYPTTQLKSKFMMRIAIHNSYDPPASPYWEDQPDDRTRQHSERLQSSMEDPLSQWRRLDSVGRHVHSDDRIAVIYNRLAHANVARAR